MKNKPIRAIGFNTEKVSKMTAQQFRNAYGHLLTPQELDYYVQHLHLIQPAEKAVSIEGLPEFVEPDKKKK